MDPVQPDFAKLEHQGFVIEHRVRASEAVGAMLVALVATFLGAVGVFGPSGASEWVVGGVAALLGLAFAVLAYRALQPRRIRVTPEELILEEGRGAEGVRRFRLAEIEVHSDLRRDDQGTTIRELWIEHGGERVVFTLPRVKPGERATAAAELQWCVDAIGAAKRRAQGGTEADEQAMKAALQGVQRSRQRE